MSCGDVEHDVSVVGVGVKVTDVPVTDQVSASRVCNCKVYDGVVSSRVEEGWG